MIQYTFAKSFEEKELSSKLVTKIYHKLGYVPEDDSQYFGKISDFIFKPASITILATNDVDSSLLGTASLAVDDADGIPMDNIFKDELGSIRDQYSKIAEVCQYAVERDQTEKPLFDISLKLLSHILYVTKHKEVDALCFTVHTKHKSFYEILGAKTLGQTKSYPSANENPAVPFYLDMNKFFLELESKPAFIRDILIQPPSSEFVTSVENIPRGT